MTDEMRIQQQTSSTPYLLGGLGVGAAGGYGLSRIDSIKNWATDPATLERLKEIGEKPDTVELSTKQKATLDSLKAKLEELKAAEAELENASKATLDPKATERVNYERAQADLKAEMEKLVEQQKAILEKGNTSTVKGLKIVSPTEVYGKVDTKAYKKYENLYNDYQKALNAAKKVSGRPEANAIESFRNSTMKEFGNIHSASVTPTATWRRVLGIKNTTSDKQVRRTVKQLESKIESIIPLNIPNDAELAKRGIDIKNKAAKKAYIQKLTDRVTVQRKALLDEILGAEQKIQVFDNKGKLVRERLSYANVEAYSKATERKMNAITKINASTTLSSTEKAAKIAEANKRFNTEMAKFFDNTSHGQKLNQKLETAILNDSSVVTANKNLKAFVYGPGHEDLRKLTTETIETAKLTQEEIAIQAKAWAEKNINKSYQDAVDLTKKLFDEAVAKSGTVDEATKTAMQGKVDKCKGELEKMGKEFCSTSKGKLALVIGGTAVAGALLAMALKPKNN